MAIFDTERLTDRVKEIIQANISAKLTEINNEYSDTIILDAIPTSAYYLNSMDPDANENPFLVYGIDNVAISTAGPAAASRYSIFVIVGHGGMRNEYDENVQRKLMRYARAIKEIMKENFDQLGGYSNLEIEEYPSRPALQTKRGEILKVSGLVFTATIS